MTRTRHSPRFAQTTRHKGIYYWLLAGCLSACTVGPDYRPPSPAMPDRWKAAGANPEAGLQPIANRNLDRWWQSFNDATLNRLMERAQSGNLDLKMATSRIEQARAEHKADRAQLYPSVSAVAVGAGFHHLIPSPQQQSGALSYFLSGFDAVWEIDIFGRLQRKLEADAAATDGAEEEYREAWVMLSAELAKAYTEYRSLQRQLDITQATLSAQARTLELSGQLQREGLGTLDNVQRAQAQWEDTQARIPSLQSQMVSAQYRMETLLATRPDSLLALLAQPGELPGSTERRLLTNPADCLRLRPDIRHAERNLAAATARQGAAIAELFPKVSIAALFGLQNSDFDKMFRSASFAWASGGSVVQPIFNFGRIQAGIDLADARQREAYWHYHKTVLEAVHETETALAQFIQEEQRRQQLGNTVDSLQEALRLVDIRYRNGLATYLEVLDAQRSLYAGQLALAQSQALATTRLIAIYKALGGGAGQADQQPA